MTFYIQVFIYMPVSLIRCCLEGTMLGILSIMISVLWFTWLATVSKVD